MALLFVLGVMNVLWIGAITALVLIEKAIGPVWETNHVWLIFVLVVLWTCFPPAYASIAWSGDVVQLQADNQGRAVVTRPQIRHRGQCGDAAGCADLSARSGDRQDASAPTRWSGTAA